MRLRTKVGVVLLVALVALSGLVFVSVEYFKAQTVADERANAEETADLAAEEIDRELATQVDSVRRFGAREGTANFSTSTQSLREFLATNPAFYAGRIVHPNGTIIDYQGEVPLAQRQSVIGDSVGDQQHVAEALAGNPVIRAPEIEPSGDNIWVVLIAAPIYDSTGGQPQGVVVGAMRIGGWGGGALPRAQRAVLGAVSPLETNRQTVRISGDSVSGERETYRPRSTEFDAEIHAEATVDRTGWQVEVIRDRGQLDDQLNTLLFLQAGGILLVFGVVGAVGVYEYRTNLRQTRKLLEGFSTLETGQFDEEVSLEGTTEWEEIGEGFNSLAESLAEREQQLSVLNRVLRHNIQNKLVVIQGRSEMIPHLDDPEQRSDAAETVVDKSQQLLGHAEKARQIDKVLDLAKEGLTTVDIRQLAEKSVASVRQDYPDATYDIEGPDEQGVWAVRGVEYAIETLVENAIEHNDADEPQVTVSIDQPAEDIVTVTIADNGPGIPEHEIEVLSQHEETDLEHGSGVGLWLAHIATTKSKGRLIHGDQTDGGEITIELHAATLSEDPDDSA